MSPSTGSLPPNPSVFSSAQHSLTQAESGERPYCPSIPASNKTSASTEQMSFILSSESNSDKSPTTPVGSVWEPLSLQKEKNNSLFIFSSQQTSLHRAAGCEYFPDKDSAGPEAHSHSAVVSLLRTCIPKAAQPWARGTQEEGRQ